MARIKILSPVTEEYILVVSIPLETPIIIVRNQTIGEAEHSFINWRDKESNHKKKVDYDRARALLKWASACNAKLVQMKNEEHQLKVYFSFATMENMVDFRESLTTNVKGATMR